MQEHCLKIVVQREQTLPLLDNLRSLSRQKNFPGITQQLTSKFSKS